MDESKVKGGKSSSRRVTKPDLGLERANDRQVGGNHYKHGIEPWDISVINGYDFFQHTILKYLHRWPEKGGIADLEKVAHYVQKYIELAKLGYRNPNNTPEDAARLREALLGEYMELLR